MISLFRWVRSSPLRSVFFLTFIYLSWRLIFLFFCHPAYIAPGGEELQRGTVASLFLQNLDFKTIWSHRPDSYAGGFIINVLLTALHFKFLPDSAFILKLPALIFSLGSLLCWYLILRSQISERSAFYFGILYTFPLFFILSFDVHNLGDHAETRFLTALSLYLFCVVSSGRFKIMGSSALAWITGFGIWYAYIYALTPLTLCVVLAIRNPTITMRRLILITISFIAGFAPWVISQLASKGGGLFIGGIPVWKYFNFAYLLPWGWVHPQYNLVAKTVTSLDYHDHTVVTQVVCFFYSVFLSVLAIASAIFCRFRTFMRLISKSQPVQIIILYPLLTILFIQTAVTGGVRFWVPLQPFLAAGVAIALAHLKSANQSRHLSMVRRSLLFLFVVTGVVSAVNRMDIQTSSLLAHLRGEYNFEQQEIREDFQYLSIDFPSINLSDLQDAHQMAERQNISNTDHDSFRKQARQLPNQKRWMFYYFLGRKFKFYGFDESHFSKLVLWMETHDRQSLECLWVGYLHADSQVDQPISQNDDAIMRKTRDWSSKLRESKHAWRWAGRLMAKKWLRREYSLRHSFTKFEVFIGDIDDPLAQKYFYEGVGSRLYYSFLNGTMDSQPNWNELIHLPDSLLTSLFSGIKSRALRNNILKEISGDPESIWRLYILKKQLPKPLCNYLLTSKIYTFDFLFRT